MPEDAVSHAALEAEEQILGGLLVDPAALEAVASIVGPADFYREHHGQILAAAIGLARDDTAIDLTTVSASLEARGVLASCGGRAYLAELANRAVAPGNAVHHAGIVRQAAERRRWLAFFEEGVRRARDGHPPSELAASVLAHLASREPAPGLLRLDTVDPQEVEWAWDRHYARGKVHVDDGDPGQGKSTRIADEAARFSTGRAWPDGSPNRMGPRGVVLANAEDGVADTIVPKLVAAGADRSRIVVLPLFAIPEDLHLLEQARAQVDAVFVSIDPLSAYLGSRIDSFKDSDIRRALAPLAAWADRTGVVVKLTRHLSKRQDVSAMYRGGGSIGIIGAARVAHLTAPDPDDAGAFVVATIKNNLAPKPPALRYRIEAAANGAARIVWLGESTHTADTLTAASLPQPAGKGIEVLRSVLAAGPLLATEAERKCGAMGVAGGTLDRAKKKLGVRSERRGFQGPVFWCLPDQLLDLAAGPGIESGGEGAVWGSMTTPDPDDGPKGHQRTPKDTIPTLPRASVREDADDLVDALDALGDDDFPADLAARLEVSA